jgi:hypothetical protein
MRLKANVHEYALKGRVDSIVDVLLFNNRRRYGWGSYRLMASDIDMSKRPTPSARPAYYSFRPGFIAFFPTPDKAYYVKVKCFVYKEF